MSEQVIPDPKTRRRSERLYLTIPIRVFATDPNGHDFYEDALTVVVSRHGGRIRLENPLILDDQIHVTNLSNNTEAAFRVVGRVGRPRPENPFIDWGVECLEPEKGVWGVEFKESPEGAGAASALLECCACGQVASVQLTDEELDTLASGQLIMRSCTRCREGTFWKYASTDRRQQEVPAISPAVSPPEVTRPTPVSNAPVSTAPPQEVERRGGEDRRQERRLALRVPMRIRTAAGAAEVGKTENMSKSGASFLSEKDYPVGATLFVAMPYTPGENPIEQKAVVETVEGLPGSPAKLYGIKIVAR